MQMSMFSSEEPHANPSRSQESASDWMTRVATWQSSLFLWLDDSTAVGYSGKMCLACFPVQEGQISPLSSASWGNAGMGMPGECWTLSISECHSAAGVCSLSDILETGDLPQRYYLSAKACAGILRRAEKRGKELPTSLHRALMQVAQGSAAQGTLEDKTP